MIPYLQAKRAAEWWADQLRITPPKRDAGDAKMNWAMKRNPKVLGDECVLAFKEALALSLITEAITSQMRYLDHMPASIAVDYDPDLILKLAAKAAEIDDIEDRLPIKTVMKIFQDHIKVSKGYGAPWVTI